MEEVAGSYRPCLLPWVNFEAVGFLPPQLVSVFQKTALRAETKHVWHTLSSFDKCRRISLPDPDHSCVAASSSRLTNNMFTIIEHGFNSNLSQGSLEWNWLCSVSLRIKYATKRWADEQGHRPLNSLLCTWHSICFSPKAMTEVPASSFDVARSDSVHTNNASGKQESSEAVPPPELALQYSLWCSVSFPLSLLKRLVG